MLCHGTRSPDLVWGPWTPIHYPSFSATPRNSCLWRRRRSLQPLPARIRAPGARSPPTALPRGVRMQRVGKHALGVTGRVGETVGHKRDLQACGKAPVHRLEGARMLGGERGRSADTNQHDPPTVGPDVRPDVAKVALGGLDAKAAQRVIDSKGNDKHVGAPAQYTSRTRPPLCQRVAPTTRMEHASPLTSLGRCARRVLPGRHRGSSSPTPRSSCPQGTRRGAPYTRHSPRSPARRRQRRAGAWKKNLAFDRARSSASSHPT